MRKAIRSRSAAALIFDQGVARVRCDERRHELLEDLPHRQVVFTIPKRLWIFFRYDRSALDGLSEAAPALGRNERLQPVRTQLVILESPCSLTTNDWQQPGLKPNRYLPTVEQVG